MSNCRENDQERLDTKVHGEDAFLQGRKGGHRKRIVADLGHDEALKKCELLNCINAGKFCGLATRTYLVELGAEKCAVDQQVVWSCSCQRAQSTDKIAFEPHIG